MVSIKTIYSRAFAVLRKKPFLLWGISLLAMLLSALSVPLLGVIPAASIAVSMLLQTAMTLIYLRGYRGEEIAVTQLFDTFKDWKTVKRVLCGMGWASLWIFLWSLIPVVGVVFGIIRTYEYRLTPYILMHEPDVPITEAIKVSREKTRGYKARMFGADALYVVVIAAAEILLALLATIPYIGVLFGILSVVKNKVCNVIAMVFVDVVRGVPMIVLAMFVFFGVPYCLNNMMGMGVTLTALQAGTICLALNCGAYMAEIIRAGIQSVDKGQMEAARSLGLPYWRAMQRVVLPQAIRTMVPSIINQFIITLKDTSILSVIGFPELVNTAKNVVANTFKSFQVWGIVAVMYLIIILILSKAAKCLERSWSRGRQ